MFQILCGILCSQYLHKYFCFTSPTRILIAPFLPLFFYIIFFHIFLTYSGSGCLPYSAEEFKKKSSNVGVLCLPLLQCWPVSEGPSSTACPWKSETRCRSWRNVKVRHTTSRSTVQKMSFYLCFCMRNTNQVTPPTQTQAWLFCRNISDSCQDTETYVCGSCIWSSTRHVMTEYVL